MLSLNPPTVICQQLGHRLRALRLLRNVSQHELAERTGASLSSIRRLEASGQASLELVVRVAQALQAAQGLDDLFAPPAPSIAQAEALWQASQRQRASKAKHTKRGGA